MTLPTNYTPWIFAFSIFQFLWSAGVAVYVWYSNKEKVTNTRFEAQDQRIATIETDIRLGKAQTETDTRTASERHSTIVKQLEKVSAEVARHSDCKYHQGFEDRLDRMNGSINKIEGVVEGRMEGIGNALDMIQQHLISGGK